MKNQNWVKVPAQTLNAVKNILFGKEGVDLSPIVNDLALNEKEKDLTAINVALTFMGAKIDIDTKTRYQHSYGRNITEYVHMGNSLILGGVKVLKRYYKVTDNKELELVTEDNNIAFYGFDQWNEMDSSLEEIIEKATERLPK